MKRYSSKEPIVFIWVIIPYIIFMNLLIFGTCVFGSFSLFFTGFFYSAIYFFIIYAIFGSVAVIIQKKFPAASDLFKRIFIMLPAFYLMNVAAIHGAFYIYGNTHIYACRPQNEMIWYTVMYACIMSTVITFINEGMANWEKWKDSLAESERLKNSYQRSRLLGLKGQIHPHFLFNCFNSLSGLIHEDENLAEKFLDEMIRVHRYMLRSGDEYLVPVEEELKFARSYLYLIQQRFGSAIEYSLPVSISDHKEFLPPLTLQVILENTIYSNTFSKASPMIIAIKTEKDKGIIIEHTCNEKNILTSLNNDAGLDNLMLKFRLLGAGEIEFSMIENSRRIELPYIKSREVIL